MVHKRTELREKTDYSGLDYSKKYSWRRWALKEGPPPVAAELVCSQFHISPELPAQLAYELNFLDTIRQSVKYITN